MMINKKIQMMIISCAVMLLSCNKEYDSFTDPAVEFKIEKTAVDILEPVYVENLGKGEMFSFWPGDEGHSYALKDIMRNYGLGANRVNNSFEYFYTRSGTYTMTIVACSYDELEGDYVESADSVIITVNPGENGNNFVSFSIDNALSGYSPEGIIKGDMITVPIGFINRQAGLEDKDFAVLINGRPPRFQVSSSTAKVFGEDDTELKGNGQDVYKLNLIDTATMEPIERKFKVVQDGNEHDYKVAAMFYPELGSFAILGQNVVPYSTNGSIPDEELVNKLKLSNPAYAFFGVLLFNTAEKLRNVVPVFDITDGAKLYLKGSDTEIVSGSTEVDMIVSPTRFEVKLTKN